MQQGRTKRYIWTNGLHLACISQLLEKMQIESSNSNKQKKKDITVNRIPSRALGTSHTERVVVLDV